MQVLRDIGEVDRAAQECGRRSGLGGVLVPTMGALHEGHAALIRHGVEQAQRIGGLCAVSIFVNPTQFNDKADFERYPKTLDADLTMCREAGAGIAFVPSLDTMYGEAAAAPVPPLPRVATEPGLEDRFRPGHFAGVCQVVLRLFRVLEPEAAVFGEKDWQQLQVISAMTRELDLPIRILPHTTLRDGSGLALSSRNRFLSVSEYSAALAIPRALRRAGGITELKRAEVSMREELASSAIEVEYAVIREAATLSPIDSVGKPARALIAARVGRTRLIDNASWPA